MLIQRFNSLNKWLRKKSFTKLNELILVLCLLSNFQCPQNNDIALPPRLLLVAPPLHNPLHPGHLFFVGCCVENCQSAAALGQGPAKISIFSVVPFSRPK